MGFTPKICHSDPKHTALNDWGTCPPLPGPGCRPNRRGSFAPANVAESAGQPTGGGVSFFFGEGGHGRVATQGSHPPWTLATGGWAGGLQSVGSVPVDQRGASRHNQVPYRWGGGAPGPAHRQEGIRNATPTLLTVLQ